MSNLAMSRRQRWFVSVVVYGRQDHQSKLAVEVQSDSDFDPFIRTGGQPPERNSGDTSLPNYYYDVNNYNVRWS